MNKRLILLAALLIIGCTDVIPDEYTEPDAIPGDMAYLEINGVDL